MAIGDGQVVAAGLASTQADSDTAVVGELAVAPGWRRQGIGRALLEEIARRATARGLASLSLGAGEAVAGFYVACGFTPMLQVTATGPDRRQLMANARAMLAPHQASDEQDNGSRLTAWVPLGEYGEAPVDELNTQAGCSALVMFSRRLPAEQASSPDGGSASGLGG